METSGIPQTLDAQSLRELLNNAMMQEKANGQSKDSIDIAVGISVGKARLLLNELWLRQSVSIMKENGPVILRLHVRTPHLQAPISVDQLFESELFARQLEKFANDYVDSAMICERLTEDDVARGRGKIYAQLQYENARMGKTPMEAPPLNAVRKMAAELVTESILKRMLERIGREENVRTTLMDANDTHVMGHDADAVFRLKDHVEKVFRGKYDFSLFTRKNEKLATSCCAALCIENGSRAAVYVFETSMSIKSMAMKSHVQKNMRHMVQREKNRDVYGLNVCLVNHNFFRPTAEETPSFPSNVYVHKRTLTHDIADIFYNAPTYESAATVLAKIQRLGAMNGRNT